MQQLSINLAFPKQTTNMIITSGKKTTKKPHHDKNKNLSESANISVCNMYELRLWEILGYILN